MDEIHPFYSDLMNVLYDKDHYKLALGQLNMAKSLIDKLSQDYVRMLKYADSQYRCKQLKVAALGRMCTIMKRQAPSLAYLEQVRQHMSRLPSIDPATRTLLVCGYPNVGKSSFMNKVTRADVEVQPYAFTTKSLYVGHMDYKYLRWQVVDSPGILDRPLEERNTIEMQSITAMAHLRAAVLYLVDLSEQCGYSIAQQAALFHSIKPLFANKPVLIVANKIDVTPLESLARADREIIDAMVVEAATISNGGLPPAEGQADECFFTMSTLTDTNVQHVRGVACERLLNSRVALKLRSKKVTDVANRIHVAQPRGGVDTENRPPTIPASVAQRRAALAKGATLPKRTTQREKQEAGGGAGVYNMDENALYDLPEEWKYDAIPEMLDGHNIADFVDPDIMARLEALEMEEEELQAQFAAEAAVDLAGVEDLNPEERAVLERIQEKKKRVKELSRIKKSIRNNQTPLPRTAPIVGDAPRRLARAREELRGRGVETAAAEARIKEQNRGRSETRKRSRSAVRTLTEDAREEKQAEKRARITTSRSAHMRSASMGPEKRAKGLKDRKATDKAIALADTAQVWLLLLLWLLMLVLLMMRMMMMMMMMVVVVFIHEEREGRAQ